MLPAHLPPARMGDRLVPRRRAAPSRQRRPRRLPPPAAARLELGHRHILKLRRATLRARGRAAAADAMAREFGFRRGALNLVNWVSDQYSQYGTKVVSVAEREAIHTLEAILHTQLPIAEHTTDTHGATVMWTVGCVKARWHQLSAGSIGSPSSSRRCARRAAVQRWRSTSRGQPRCAASSARRSSVSRRVRSLGA